MSLRGIVVIAMALLSLAAPSSGQRTPTVAREEADTASRVLAEIVNPTLTRFASEEEFRRYLGAVLATRNRRSRSWSSSTAIQFAQLEPQAGEMSDAVEPICPADYPDCMAEDEDEYLTVTGSRIPAPTNPSITNNQMRNVEEGDIVKQIGQFLLVLQDGRIFTIDTRAGDGRRLALVDRINVYRDAEHDMWYDEMLVLGDHILITGYSYRERATELSVFRLDASGRLGREGVFYVSSNDYYDSSNYATRLVDGNLVIYTPFGVTDMAAPSFKWPVVRRWMPHEDYEGSMRRDRPLFDATGIFRPVRDVEDPMVHSVSVCPLGSIDGMRELQCRTTAFVGPNRAQWYVTEDDAFLWMTSRYYDSYDPQACDVAPPFEQIYEPALLYRVPLGDADAQIVATRGVPPDQFSLQSSDGRFRALVKDRRHYCEEEDEEREEARNEARLAYLDFPLAQFADIVREVPYDLYARLPGVQSNYIANRFTDRYLVYGSLERFRRRTTMSSMPPAYVVPLGNPGEVRALDVNHTINRAEQAGNDIILTGYRNWDGLVVTMIDLDGPPRISSSLELYRRFESEGRSHAFNSLIEDDGSGVMGFPTIGGHVTWSSRAPWRTRASDLSYLTVDRRGRLEHVGELERRFRYANEDEDDEDGVPGYECEVSCVDWYGNSRPIFTDGRIFALAGTELIEGRIAQGQMFELQRLNIAIRSTSLAARMDDGR